MKIKISPDAMIVVGALGVAAFLAAQQSRQEWTVDRGSEADTVRFGIERIYPGRRIITRSDRPLADFQGLSRNASGRTHFDYVQDAGTLICEGHFILGHGSGTFQLQPNRRFVRELQSLGYEAPNDDQIFDMMLNQVSLEFARGLHDMGMQVSLGEMLELRGHGVTLALIRTLRDAGYPTQTARDVIDLKEHGVSPEFLTAARHAGYSEIAVSKITELKDHGIGPGYLRSLAAYGLHPSASELIDFKNHGIEPEFLRDVQELGFDFSPREIVQLKDQGVDAKYLRNIRDSGIRNLTAEQIVKLKSNGVE